MTHALRIAATPRSEWGSATDKLPEACPHVDCSAGQGCRERVRDYLRTQYRMAARRDRAAGKVGGA